MIATAIDAAPPNLDPDREPEDDTATATRTARRHQLGGDRGGGAGAYQELGQLGEGGGNLSSHRTSSAAA